MSDWLETRLREATNERAEYAMTHTDTERELHRFRGQLARNQRSRRIRITVALAATAAVAAGVVVLVLALTGSGNTSAPKTLTPAPGSTSSQAPAPTLPADYPLGTWERQPQSRLHETLIFNDVPTVTERDNLGPDTQRVTFPAAHEMTFSRSLDGNYCTTSGTYRYSIHGHLLRFVVVGHDPCKNRSSYLLGHAWRFSG